MTFSPGQKVRLDMPLDHARVKTRKQGGRGVSFIEAWDAIQVCNDIFGFDGWMCECVHFECVDSRECTIGDSKVPGWNVTYIAKVRVNVWEVIREGCGAGHGIDRNLGQAHESALKEAESDAFKRAMRYFGNQFGLALYDKQQTHVTDPEPPPPPSPPPPQITAQQREDFFRGAKEHIGEFGHDWPLLHAWWQSSRQQEGRRKYLSPAEREELMLLMLSKKPPEESKEGG